MEDAFVGARGWYSWETSVVNIKINNVSFRELSMDKESR